MNNIPVFSQLGAKILICFLLLLQLFPPLWIQDVTSLRHFLIALFDVSALALITVNIFQKKILVANVFKFKPLLLFGLLLFWMAISIIWAINKTESIAVLNRWILIFLVALLTGVMLENNPKIFNVLVYCTIIITIVNVLTCIIGYYYFDLHISQRRNLMLNGGYGNKNIFAVCLMFKLPFLYYAILRYKRVWKIISSILVAAVCFCLVIISTRSTFISLFLQLLILVAYAISEKIRFKANNRYVLYIAAIVVFALSGFFGGNKFIQYNYNHYATHNVQNNYTVAARVQSIEEGNSKGRLLIWRNTLEIIKMKPVLGYGIGNHKLNIMRVEAKKKMNYVVSDHAHNDFLEMQSELGIVGEFLYILLYISVAIVGLRVIFNKKTQEWCRLTALCSLLLLITYGIDALFNFPNERATPQIYLALSVSLMMTAYFKSNFDIKQMQTEKSVDNNDITARKKVFFIVIFILSIGLLYIETCHFISSVVQHSRILCYNSKNKKQIPPSHWVNVTPWLPNIDESTKPLAINNASMFAMEGDYRTAIDMILTDDSNPFYGLKEYRLASYYAHLGMTDSSEYWADKCIVKKPLCYDPVSVKIGNRKRVGDTQGQIVLLNDYLKREQREERAWLALINIFISQGNLTEAEKTIEQSLLYNPQNSRILSKKDEIRALQDIENHKN